MRLQVVPLMRGMVVYGIGDVLSKLINILMLPLFTAYLTPADYGISSILNLATTVLIAVFSLGLGTSFTVVYSRSGQASASTDGDPNPKATTVWTTLGILTVSVVLMSLVSVVFARSIAQSLFQAPIDPYYIQLSFVTDAFTILSIPVSLYYQMEQRAGTYVAISLSSAIISIILNILMVVVLRMGVMGWLMAGLVSQGAMLLLYVLPALPRLPFRFSLSVARELLRLGLPLVPAVAFVFVMQQSNLFFLERFAGLAQAGIYSVGVNLGSALNMVVFAFTRAWTPYFLSYTARQSEARTLFGRITTYYVIGIGSISLCFFIFARSVILVMTTPTFHSAYSVVGFAATTQFLTGLFSVLLPAIYFASAVASVSLIQAGAAVVTVLSCLLAIPLFGATGAAAAAAIGTGAMCLLTLIWNHTHKDYFQVAYERQRLRRFAVIYTAIMLISLIPRNFSLPLEILFAVIGAAALLVSDYSLLLDSEKQTAGGLLRRATHLLRIRSANS